MKEAAAHRDQRRDARAEPRGDLPPRLSGRGRDVSRAAGRLSIRTQRRAAIGWGIGLAAVATMYAAFYPSITEGAAQLQSYMDNLPEAIRNLIGVDYTSPAGYLRAELFARLGRSCSSCTRSAPAHARSRERKRRVARPAAVDAADAHPDRARQGRRPAGRDVRPRGVPVRGGRGDRPAVRSDRAGRERGGGLRDAAAARVCVRVAGARGRVRDRPEVLGLRRHRRGQRSPPTSATTCWRRPCRRSRGHVRPRPSGGIW